MAEKIILDMIFVQNVCVFGTISKRNDCSFCCFLNHICFCKSRVMLRFVRQGKILFVPTFYIQRNRSESFNNKKVNLWGQWWKKLLTHLLVWYLLLSCTHTNTQTHTHTHTLQFLYLCHTQIGLCVFVCMYVCVYFSTRTITPYIQHTLISVCVCVCTCMCVCMCACVYVFVCVLLSNNYHSKRCFGDFFHNCPHD